MPLHPTIQDIALRLLLTLVAGAMIGIDRGERGHAAGLRTTTLVCLAACVAMIQMNILLPVSGKTPESFSVMDIMRLPLGILSGMGFIGAGAILRKGDAVTGVTTAATLWLVTMIGLCFGGGQLWLGAVTTALAWFILYVLKRVDLSLAREHKALLKIQTALAAPVETELIAILSAARIKSSYVEGCYDHTLGTAELTYDIRWHARWGEGEPREVLDSLLKIDGVRRILWDGVG